MAGKPGAQKRSGKGTKARSRERRGGAGGTKRATDWQETFLKHFEDLGLVSRAAAKTKVAPRTVYREIKRNAKFATRFAAVDDAVTAAMEAELHRRAVEGIDEPVFHQGKEVATVKRYSDRLLVFALKARRPDKYRERVEVSGKIDVATQARKEAEEKDPEELDTALTGVDNVTSLDQARKSRAA